MRHAHRVSRNCERSKLGAFNLSQLFRFRGKESLIPHQQIAASRQAAKSLSIIAFGFSPLRLL
jgi:hypothetical protein